MRNVPEDVVATLEARGQSLAAYLRDLLADEAARPSIEAIMGIIATRTPVNYALDEGRPLFEDGRR